MSQTNQNEQGGQVNFGTLSTHAQNQLSLQTKPTAVKNKRGQIEPTQLVGIDIGTSKIVVMIANMDDQGNVQVCGIGQQSSAGCLKKGMVIDMNATMVAIQSALKEAELMSDTTVTRVWTGVAGSHIRSINTEGMVAVRDREVSQQDIARVLETARAVQIPNDQQVLHVLAQEYKVDDQAGVKDPINMAGMRLQVRVHIVTGGVTAISNIVKCVTRCGLETADVILQPLASSHAVLTADEKDLGVVMVDIGGGTTDIAIFTGGAIRYTAVLPIAGDQITNDIAIALRTPTLDADDIKLRYAVAKQNLVDPLERIEVPGLGDRQPRMMSRQSLASVVEPRVSELFGLVNQVVANSGYAHLVGAGYVLTGGTAIMPGMLELAEDVFGSSVRIGSPLYFGALQEQVQNPRFATVIGLLHEARKATLEGGGTPVKGNHVGQILGKMKNWFGSSF